MTSLRRQKTIETPNAAKRTEVLVSLSLLIPEQLWQTLLKSLQYLDIREILLRKPRRNNHAQLRLDCPEALRLVTYHHDRLLYRTPSYVGRFVYEETRIQLPCTRYAEERSRWVGGGGRPPKREVGVIFCGAGLRLACRVMSENWEYAKSAPHTHARHQSRP